MLCCAARSMCILQIDCKSQDNFFLKALSGTLCSSISKSSPNVTRSVSSSRRTSPSCRRHSALLGVSFHFLLTVNLRSPSDLWLLDVHTVPCLEERVDFTTWLGVIARPPFTFAEMHMVDFAFAYFVWRSASVQEKLCNLRQALFRGYVQSRISDFIMHV